MSGSNPSQAGWDHQPSNWASVSAHSGASWCQKTQKLSSQNMLMPPFSKHVSHEESCSLAVPVQKDDYLTFFLSSVIFPHTPLALSHKYPKLFLHLQGGRYEICSVSSLGCLINKLSLPQISGSAFGWLHNKQRTRWVPMFVNSRKIENGKHEQRIQYIIWQADHEIDLLKELY